MPGPTPMTLRAAVWLLATESAAFAVLVGLLIYGDLTGGAETVQGAVGVTIYTALVATAFGAFAWALHHGKGWARGPAIVLHLLMLPIGYTMLTNGQPVLGVVTLALGVLGAGLLLAPSTREFLVGRRTS
jgi:hypothetical protein